jgi:hypothetical protein
MSRSPTPPPFGTTISNFDPRQEPPSITHASSAWAVEWAHCTWMVELVAMARRWHQRRQQGPR